MRQSRTGRLDYSGFIAKASANDGGWLGLGGMRAALTAFREEEAGCFLPDRTDSSAAAGAEIARSGKRL